MSDTIPPRCMQEGCNKKLKLFHYKCRCQQYYCLKHRASEEHNCTYDYKKNLNREKMAEEMKCVASRVEVI
jgi:hypothetical protein